MVKIKIFNKLLIFVLICLLLFGNQIIMSISSKKVIENSANTDETIRQKDVENLSSENKIIFEGFEELSATSTASKIKDVISESDLNIKLSIKLKDGF